MTRRLILAALLVVAALVGWRLGTGQLSLERIVGHEREIRLLIASRPGLAFAVAFGLYVLISIFPGSGGKSVVVGWLFGFWQAFVMVTGALTIAGIIAFSVARYFLRDALRDRFTVPFERFDRSLARDGALYLLTARLLHVPYSLVNYAAGVGAVPLRTFVWTTWVGLVPGTTVLVGVGAGLPSLSELLERGVLSLVDPLLLGALAALGIVPLGLHWVVGRLSAADENERRR